MNQNMMLLMVLALGSSSSSNGSKGSSSDFLDAYLISSNMLPEMMRLMFAMMSIQKRNDRTNTLARETADAMIVLKAGEKDVGLPKTKLDALPELKGLLDRVPTERDKIVDITKSASSIEGVSETRALAKGKARHA
jgi:hypothetical protein